MRRPYFAGPDKQITLIREVDGCMWVTELDSSLAIGPSLVGA